ncbi:serine/threonine-protein kinase [Nocardioides bizhenqiangii]|uniref:Protein kinase n=1 Tax=Nocardioides bizhenqiangii TaxID=3095076 RepID=A0ABZ0ZTB5_9ACTN|nr:MULTISPECIES: protein kinase [unclassified Nocardioides]MDZ5621833.1 protein kinase [Nocardioides sp. HM23]WQQ27483.1 protein kinase [Nocardioides sp. HM61]
MTTPDASSGTAEPALDATVEFRPPPEPVVLGDRYRLGEVIGRGGMAEVYRADDLKLARLVAVKILLDGAGDETDRERFIAEAKTLAMLSHTGLVTVLDAGFGTSNQQRAVTGGQEHDRPFLVMELVEGQTLGRLMKDGPMSIADLAPIAAQVADALAYVHARGVVHRDVKPANVLVGHDQAVKLADFGIARLVEQRSHHTRTGMAIGTAAYIAPEQVNGGTVDGAADVYAFGLVLLEAITGRREYAGAPAEAALARLHRPPEIPALDPGWHDLLTGMTALDPSDRPSAADVAAWLRAGLTEPAPVGTVGVPDAATSPILAASPQPPVSGAGVTKPMTSPDAAAPAQPRTAVIDRTGDALARQVRKLTARLRTLSSEAWGVAAALGALVVLLIVLAVASGDESAPTIPDNTPADLREPLTELHIAINGEEE